ncbi:MAG: chemotaxis response regulator protein-glutamate methylesterase [Gammaproteobacteria bacterium]
MDKMKVLVIDDSALVRNMLTEILNSDNGIEVVGTASDPIVARNKIKALNPDVLTLDVEMPEMDGITFLRNLMRLRPMPVVMVSTLTEQGADVTLDAMELGAIDFITKPKTDFTNTIKNYSDELIQKVKTASKAKVQPLNNLKKRKVTLEDLPAVEPANSADAVISKQAATRPFKTTDKIIAIGSSTGGTEALKVVLAAFPADAPATVISQHIPGAFSGPFAARVNQISAVNVKEAEDGEQILRGHVYIAPGGQHLLVERSGARFICRLSDGPPVNRHKPSVDVMFRSIAQNVGANAIGVILTGMGNDGAQGLKEMQEIGSPTIAQDEQSSVVWGMPGEAVKLGAADEILPLAKIGDKAIKQAFELMDA